jgi:branched-subunit amino acid aminotransferase/4-amino-4-deoxychorismate lyase
MNVLFVIGYEVVTPVLNGSILPGNHPQGPPSSSSVPGV